MMSPRHVLDAVDRNGLHLRTKEFLNIHDAMRMALSLHTLSQQPRITSQP